MNNLKMMSLNVNYTWTGIDCMRHVQAQLGGTISKDNNFEYKKYNFLKSNLFIRDGRWLMYFKFMNPSAY